MSARRQARRPARTQGMPREGPATLVASTILPRTPGRAASQRPMIVSVAPKVSARGGTEYISAVSMKLMPRSSARSRIAWASGFVRPARRRSWCPGRWA